MCVFMNIDIMLLLFLTCIFTNLFKWEKPLNLACVLLGVKLFSLIKANIHLVPSGYIERVIG